MSNDFIFNVQPNVDLVFDIETYPNIFTCTVIPCDRDDTQGWYFEISEFRNDTQLLCEFLEVCRDVGGCRMVGYNNLGFDYPVIHFIYQNRDSFITYREIYKKAMDIIGSFGPGAFAHMVWESDHIVPQLDLMKIHHFDNRAKSTSLKMLEFNMEMDSIEDLPLPLGVDVQRNDVRVLAEYNMYDCIATRLFYHRSKGLIALREQLSSSMRMNLMNCSDIKLGEKILVNQMEQRGIVCYERVGGRKLKRQTLRESIDLSEVVFPYIEFTNPEFRRIKDFLSSQVIDETVGVFKGLSAEVDNVKYVFGTGGLHASVDSKIIVSDDRHQIIDIDVASYYPNLAIKNNIYPAHLGSEFCEAYEGVYETRKTYPKGTAENEAYKLALVGAYGGSNNQYSPFFDSLYTMSITINGQLLLCMLIEQLVLTPGLTMIQANTDGVTCLCPREYINHVRNVCQWWEETTALQLEETLYDKMCVRDVNSYIAKKDDGSIKRIGAYAHVTATENPGTRELPYHKNWSSRVIAKAAEAYLMNGTPIEDFITGHDNIYDFMLRTKVPRGSRLEWGGEIVPNIIRYFISKKGRTLEKIMPPKEPEGTFKRKNKITDDYYYGILIQVGEEWDERIHTKNKSKHSVRVSGIHPKQNVTVCNNIEHASMSNINRGWYIEEAKKLTKLEAYNGCS
jgi:hypothetical protein